MSVFMVTWNLNKERGNYDKARREFIRHLDRYPSINDPGLESVRWVQSNGTAGETQAQNDLNPEIANYPFSHLKNQLTGHYQVIRRDERVISILYAIDFYHSGAAHGGRSSTATNYLVRPFTPITLDYLLGDIEHLPALADYIRERLSETGEYEDDWLAMGTRPIVENFSLFNIERYGLTFTFPEYSIACFAAGEQKLWVGFDSLAAFFDPHALASIQAIEKY